jgi:CRP/FNR family transcriptional regulator
LGRLYADGEAIVRQGEVGNSMFLIQFGSVGVFIDSDGEEQLLRHLKAGDFFGELSVFDHQARSATVRAEGEARILTLDKRTLLRRFHEDPSLAYRVVETLSHRVRQLTDELTDAREAIRSEGTD